jgi:hypothetical protein
MIDPLPIRLGAAIAWLEDAQEAVSKAMFHLLEYQKSLSARSDAERDHSHQESGQGQDKTPNRDLTLSAETRADNP